MENNTRKHYERDYRRTYEKKRDHRAAEPETGYKDVFLVQCVVCAIMMAFVMGTCLLDITPVQSLRQSLKEGIARKTTAEDVTDFVASLGDMKYSVDNIFGYADGNEPPQAQSLVGTSRTQQQPENNYDSIDEPLTEQVVPQNTMEDFRIDEDILEAINNKIDSYDGGIKPEGDEPKKPPAEDGMR